MAQGGRRRRPARDAVPGGWQARLTRVIAGEVRLHRKRSGLSVQELADRCEQLGLSMPRPVLSNLENGRRDSVSVGELIILAAALDVPPVLLIAPVGHQSQVEIFPDRETTPFAAMEWFSGSAELVLTGRGIRGRGPLAPQANPAQLYREYVAQSGRQHRTRDELRRVAKLADGSGKQADFARQDLQRLERMLTQGEAYLAALRSQMAERQLLLPPNWPDFSE